MKRLMLVVVFLSSLLTAALAGDIGFIEDFALAKDRAAALKSLIPGTEDYYYYHCLHYLQQDQFAKAEELTRPWLERHGQTPRLLEIQLRHALLTYERNPQRSVDFLKEKLGLRYDHQRETPGVAPNLPTALDQKLISLETLRSMSMQRWKNLDNFSDHALDWLAEENLDPTRRRHLLQRLTRPDVPNLVKLVHDELATSDSAAFGSYPVHNQLTIMQLEELVKLRPDLLLKQSLVNAWLAKLRPSADEDWRHDRTALTAYLDRLWAFVSRLGVPFRSLQAHVLYHRLVLDRTLGIYDQTRFIEYLKLPRQAVYASKNWLEREEARQYQVDLNASFEAQTLLPAVGDDEPLVRGYLKQLLMQAQNTQAFDAYVNDVYLKQVFAATKIENGLGEPEQWASLLSPEEYQKLKERVDIDFAYTNPQHYQSDDSVTLDLHIKNVPSLLVRIFEINTASYYREHKKEVDTDIPLDGLVPNEELTVKFSDSPFRRVARRIELPRLKKAGVYVVDFIGAGKSSRALIRKGRLRSLVSTSSIGQTVTVIDEANRKVMDARLWLGGQEFLAEKDGTILVPFSTQPGGQRIILSRGDFASLDTLQHQGEDYALHAGIHVERESLLSQRVAKVMVRPQLLLNGQPISLRRLEEVKLIITSTDQDGIASTLEVPDFKLFEDRESVHEFRVPTRLLGLQVQLRAKVKSLSLSKEIELADAKPFTLNTIDRQAMIADMHLAKFGANYVLEVLGKTGEVIPEQVVKVRLSHRDFKEMVEASLKSDKQGNILLGPLADITHVQAAGPSGIHHEWELKDSRHTYHHVIHVKAGETVTVPWLGAGKEPNRGALALFEMRDQFIVADRFEALAIRNGMVEIGALPAGDYQLHLKDQQAIIYIRVASGPVVAGHVLGVKRQLELARLKPVQVESITSNGKEMTVQLRDASPFARVHVFITRYQPEYSAFENLNRIGQRELTAHQLARNQADYLTGRDIGDEYRYVLDRKGIKKYAGNMLERPQLLLNPWAVQQTETSEQIAKPGEQIEELLKRLAPSEGDGIAKGKASGSRSAPPVHSNLDFLADAALVAANLVPDKDGVIKLPIEGMKTHGWVHVVAVHPENTTYRSMSLPEQPVRILDLRLRTGLDPAGHFTQQKTASVLNAGKPLTIADVAASRFEAYDSLSKVYTLYSTLNPDPKLLAFSFILNWPTLKPDEKRKYYSQYACHELNFFLMKKDPAFFAEVIKPSLANKKDKTFLDHWLLEADLSSYLEPWQYARLNVVERVLLSQRLAGEPAATQRSLNDAWRMLPPDAQRLEKLFETAIKARALEGDSPNVHGLNLSPEGKIVSKQRLELQSKDIQEELSERRRNTDAPINGKALSDADKNRLFRNQSLSRQDYEANARARINLDGAERKKDEKTVTKHAFVERDAGIIGGQKKDEQLFYYDPALKVLNGQVPRLYRKVDPTQELAENNYYQLPIQQQLAALVTVNPFWLDYSRHDGKTPFFSRHLPQASRSFTEIMFALAVVDLPFTAGKHEVKFDGPKMTYTPATPVIAFHEEIKPSVAAPGNTPILLSQNFYRPSDRYRETNGEKIDHFLTGEFLTNTVYGCQVVVTNPTSSRQKLTALLQIPLGAMPLARGQQTKSVNLELEPYRTQTLDYLFYFPLPGKFAHFPVHVAKNEQHLVNALAATFDVVEKPSQLDKQSWDYVSQQGTAEEVLALLNRENVQTLNLGKIAFRMRDKAFYDSVLSILRSRHRFEPMLWSYSLLHNDVPTMREYLRQADQLVAQIGNGPLDSPLLTVDPVERLLYQHLEYKPLVNARAHALGQRRQIVNVRLNQQYHHFLKMMSYKKQLDDADLLTVTYYLLLQDRIEEAAEMFGKVQAARLSTRMQYDYCAAYLAMFGEDVKSARQIAEKYAQHPVDRWRNLFAAMINQLDEAEGKGVKVADADDRAQQQGALAAGEPSVDFKIEGKSLKLSWHNLEKATIHYYPMDVELLFSRQPFLQEYGSGFATIKPVQSQEVVWPARQHNLTLPVPEAMQKKNVLIEVSGGGKSKMLPYFANAMTVTMHENYGQLKVVETAGGKLLPKVYVKVYARLANGQVKFHKDGYTDHRGKFDYASVSTPEKTPIERFAVLVLSEEQGAVIREAGPPAQ